MFLGQMIEEIRISNYDYDLPQDRIAKHPLKQRDQSKLLLFKDKTISEDRFKNIADYFPEGAQLFLNNTKVVRARLRFRKSTGATIEIFLLEPVSPVDYQQAFASTGSTRWKCLVGNLKRWKGEKLMLPIPGTDSQLTACLINRLPDGVTVELNTTTGNLTFAHALELCGEIPIPPYLNRESEQVDRERYQTVYARPEGSVAAPTAGLHFTRDVFSSLKQKRITPQFVTLHVGAGTFKPVKTDSILEHEMHTEHFFVERDIIRQLAQPNRFRVVVGTTTLRTIESLYWLGVKAYEKELHEPFFVSQWEPYRLSGIEPNKAFGALNAFMDQQGIGTLSASTQIIIAPGYQIRTIDALVTNFHQPRSTLLLLVAALIGEHWRNIYKYALENNFRFLSYGDGMLLFRPGADKQ